MELYQVSHGLYGVILVQGDHVLKAVKDHTWGKTAVRENQIYEKIEAIQDDLRRRFRARIPRFYPQRRLPSFCVIERIYSCLAGYGTLTVSGGGKSEREPDHGFGQGHVLGQYGGEVMFKSEGQEVIGVDVDQVYRIGRPDRLIHLCLDCPWTEWDHETDDRGVTFGKDRAIQVFGEDVIRDFINQVGAVLAFLIFTVHLIPTGVKVVIGSGSWDDLIACPWIFDFADCGFYDTLDENTVSTVARCMFHKGGRDRFPNEENDLYEPFHRGFLAGTPPDQQDLAQHILDEYNSHF